MRDRISIIVPLYNAENTLEKCINSLINQSYTDIEVILVNDGSGDSSYDICKKYESLDKRIVIINKKNGGVSSARNAGLEIATGEFIMFCDSDDWVDINWCKAMYDNYTDDNLLMCKTERGENSEKNNKYDSKRLIEKIDKSKFMILYNEGICSPWNKIFKASIIQENHIRFPLDFSLGEDLHFVIEYLKHIQGDILLLNEKLYNYVEIGGIGLSKTFLNLEQCKKKYSFLANSFEIMNINDEESVKIMHAIIMQQYEKCILNVSKNTTFLKKYYAIKKILKEDTFIKCCKRTQLSTNCIYNFIIKNRMAFLLTLYLSLKK